MSEALIERLVEFAESGNQQKIILNGTSYQGWIMEITEDALLISTGFADKSGKDFWLKFDDLDSATLYYWDNHSDEWVEFKL
ncbi:hypothetical protein L313_1445 [Acinetobacter haemolyticus CIP 64.3 = MTCC 9819]|uniref:Uncharacterized protein n=1 Tax=Acinetobacter haemolyticus CIP 64.3 = MTCC 9819 TaxID=1217659 RepID=N9FD34_ACIHA|nr:hypothetical protein [Acinetobacter haemolyticus]ENW20462.1 hypothetical protein F927_00946 [Acinetobacter haemolyticus CIP 64.3 = MTCC 9819]EPR89325.1 hypothetical protein L313_1445 [Acinetobacter haemolyticus CIP 64.3 = MTCC 9819]QXZ27599.1 hypothetical protein I6L22_04790 [Acinetobacter haemolyticus]WPO67417.1 hypothetical protein SDC64_00255 [Acinetobacter haemolyticus]SPT45996.1 Uncharacterised protein [Acinetobacter haemolyticus]